MNEYKTVNQLLRENGNLALAVSVLIRGCLNKGLQAVSEWDKIRSTETQEYKAKTMKYYTIYYSGELDQHIQETFSEEQIIESYFEYWSGKMKEVGKEDMISKERCIEDWIVVHWAVETDKLGNRLEEEIQ
jgi:hypothetical protein